MRVVVERSKERLVRHFGEVDPLQEIPGYLRVQHKVHETSAGRDVKVAFHWLNAVRGGKAVVPPALGVPAQEAVTPICNGIPWLKAVCSGKSDVPTFLLLNSLYKAEAVIMICIRFSLARCRKER